MSQHPWSSSIMASATADLGWKIAQFINRRLPEGDLPKPPWAPGKLLKSYERKRPPLGVPRTTLSICPKCNAAAARAVINGQRGISDFRENPGIIQAKILEEAGRILMRKICAEHGPFEDVLSTDPAFFLRMEELYTGQDFDCAHDNHIHNHGPSSIRSGRGAFLIVDLTNRCNMKCSPCFMDANHVGHVHELAMEDVKAIFKRALSFKPRREINVLFSGGEPTLSPLFLDAVRYARSLGFKRLYAATNGIRFAESADFVREVRAAGLHGVYLQFDGVSEKKNEHRGVGNLFEVKLQALENIARAGMRTTLQVTVINGLNNDGLGEIVEFAIQNIDRIDRIAFQPIMFAGRDENVEDEVRYARRYTLSQLTHDLKRQVQTCSWEPMRDWFPMAMYGVFGHLADTLQANDTCQGSHFPNTHPDRGIFSLVLVNRRTKGWVPVSSFFNLEQFVRDITVATDSARGPALTKAQVALSLLRNYNPQNAPSSFKLWDLPTVFGNSFLGVRSDHPGWTEEYHRVDGDWRVLFVDALWFQDLFSYDLSAIPMSNTPVATQDSEVSFCAYNAAGWRKVVEHVYMTAKLSEWHKKEGRHPIYSNGKLVPILPAATPQTATNRVASCVITHKNEPQADKAAESTREHVHTL